MESTLKNMVLTLGVITLVASAAVGAVYALTKEPIEAAKRAKTTAALASVLPPFEGEPVADTVTVDGTQAIVYTAMKADSIVGYAVQSITTEGFGGEIKFMTGFDPGGSILKIEVLAHAETPGLGDKLESGKSDFSVQFEGRSPGQMKMAVRKDGGEVDAITAATISSRACINAISHAWEAFLKVKGEPAPEPVQSPDAATGATSQKQSGDE